MACQARGREVRIIHYQVGQYPRGTGMSGNTGGHESSRRFGTGVLKSKRKDKRKSERGKKGGKGDKARPPEGY